MAAIIKSSIDRGRSLISEVEPIRDPGIGLVQAIKKSIRIRLAAMPIKMRFKHPKKLPRMSFAVKANVLRIVQEALTNVRKHSQATEVLIKLEFLDDKTRVAIKDNGVGFATPASWGDLARMGKLGLVGIQERVQLLGGKIDIESQPGKGTVLTVEIPL